MTLLLCLLLQDFREIDSGIRNAKPGNDAIFQRITDEASLKALWEHLPSSQRAKEMPKVDFSRKMVFALLPSFDSDRTRLTIESLNEEKATLTLTYSLTPTGVEGGPQLRWPYVLVEVPRSASPVNIVQFLKEPATGKRLREKIVKTLEALK
jgi:hypothetical protein